ncbi:MAG: hypothetical protein P1P74_10445 [Desulfuromonadales bacterium]|nr:hypothetical protein [Desulfuromonadales bacterium]MDT8423695.1 hypothetical protein [Desulfuromonadales bacterium]
MTNTRNMTAPSRKTCWGLFSLCLATLMYELILTRIFSVLMWYHFASMAISLALFGLGTAALVVYLLPRYFPTSKANLLAARCAVLFGLCVAFFFGLFYLFHWSPQFGFKVLSFFHQPFYQPFQQGFYDKGVPGELLLVLAALYLLTALPFFFSGLAVTLLLSRYVEHINRLYCWDLLGAGTGCLLIILLLKLVGGVTALPLIATIGLLAAALLTPTGGGRMPRVVLGGLLCTFLLLAAGNYWTGFADIRFVRGRYEPNLLWSSWNSFSRVAVYPSQSQEMGQAWGLSRTYRGPVPEQLGMVVDDTGYTTMYRWNGDEGLDFFRNNVIALPYTLKEHARGLVIGPGGGKDVLAALSMGAAHVTAVEVNPLIVQAVNEEFGAFTGQLYQRPEVRVVIDEGRSFIRRSAQRYDVIQASAVFGRMAPAAGAFTLSENNLYTLEAFHDYWDHLTDDGILTISRFIFERESLRLVSLGLALLNDLGVADPAQHIAVIKERGLANFMLKRSPFTVADIARLKEEARDKAFQIVLLPGQTAGDGPFWELLSSNGSEAFYRDFPFNVRPTDDNNPFFYYMYKPVDFIRLFTFPEQSNFEDRAVLILRNLLLVVTVLVALFIVAPLWLTRRGDLARSGMAPIGYFACLGLGFMLIEIGLLRRFILFLGPPIYSLAVILFSLLIFSGLGSLLAGRITRGCERQILPRILLALVLLFNLYIFALSPVLETLMGSTILWRCLIATLLLAPLGLLLGMPLPLGMRLFHGNDATGVPWSWGINSATSVLGAILAVVMAMNFGFNVTLLAGETVYLLALGLVLLVRPTLTTESS